MTTEATMRVRVRDRSAEAPWGVGLTNPVVRTVTISASCRVCGERRGKPRNMNQVDDGVHYSVDVWDNPCGHADPYTSVLAEAADLAVDAAVAAAVVPEGVYTAAQLRTAKASERPQMRSAGDWCRVAAARIDRRDKPGEPVFRVPTPCCAAITEVPQWSFDKPDGWSTQIECGKPWPVPHGEPRRDGCRARYEVVAESIEPDAPGVFRLTWTGRFR